MLNVKTEPATPDNSALIDCGHGHFAIVDLDWFDVLSQFKWHTRKSFDKFYARTTIYVEGISRTIPMHRLVAMTPRSMVCHHLNHNSLDNRRFNLLNSTKEVHLDVHNLRRFVPSTAFKTRRKPEKSDNSPF